MAVIFFVFGYKELAHIIDEVLQSIEYDYSLEVSPDIIYLLDAPVQPLGFCPVGGSTLYDFSVSDYGFEIVQGKYVAGVGFQGIAPGINNQNVVIRLHGLPTNIDHIDFTFNVHFALGTNSNVYLGGAYHFPETNGAVISGNNPANGDHLNHVVAVSFTANPYDELYISITKGGGGTSSDIVNTIKSMLVVCS